VGRRRIEVTKHSAAAPDAVFALLVDGNSWPRWSPIESFELERAGDPPPEGVGAVRVFRRGRTTGRDQIAEMTPGRRFGYVSLSGLPVRDYRAHIDLEPDGDGTKIRWQARSLPRCPGRDGSSSAACVASSISARRVWQSTRRSSAQFTSLAA
jgi:Polyketide cyclase / dehydrase and lipid transport